MDATETPLVNDRDRQRLAELEDLKRPRVSPEGIHNLRERLKETPPPLASLTLAASCLQALLDEIDRLELRWQRMAAGGPMGVARRKNKSLEERITLLGLQIRQQGQVIERLKAKHVHLAARADADEALLARLEMRKDLDARVAESALRQAQAMGVELEEERANHEITRARLAEARGEGNHASEK